MDNLPQIISGGTFGAGTLENILQGIQQNSYRNKIMSLLNNPAALAAMASKLQKPLDAGLTQSVTNQVQGDMAERGLSQAPGIFAASESQALAPFVQQNQQTAMNTVLQLLGMPAGTFKSPSNNSGALQMFLKSLNRGGGGGDVWGGGSVGGISDPSLGGIQYMPGGGPDVPPPTFDPSWVSG